MDNKILKKYCSECEHMATFEQVTLVEEVEVKDLKIKNEHIYYKCSECKELFEPFDNPDYNLKLDFDRYKEIKGLLSSEKVREIRRYYALSLRQMAELLGTSYSTLSGIENGSIQSKLLNSALLAIQDPIALRNVFKSREPYLKENFDGFLIQLDLLCISEKESVTELKEEIASLISILQEQTNSMLNRVNLLEYDNNHSNDNTSSKRNGESTWIGKITNILPLP